VHPPVNLTIQATPAECLRAIADAAKPSLHRLHHRNLFTDGRRYYLNPLKDGFWMTSNSKILWRRRTRTSVAAIVNAQFSPVNDDTTRITLYARMRLLYFADIFLIPLFISSILIFAPWPTALIAGLSITLFSLSWIGHRLTAAIQATDMVYFVQKALEDIAPANAPQLPAGEPEMITSNREFRREWQKFYREHQTD
jgi:hypothetical protein